MNHELSLSSPESAPELSYPEGWREILEAPDAVDYQVWLESLTDLTESRLREAGAEIGRPDIDMLWRQALEQVADVAIDPEDAKDMTEAEIVETAMITLRLNIENMGWDEEGLVFTVPNMFTGEEATIDLREL